MDDDEENLFGDFEDLDEEEEEKSKGKDVGPERDHGDSSQLDLLVQKKANLKAAFDEEYDTKGKRKKGKEKDEEGGEADEDSHYFNTMKAAYDKQKEKNLEAFKDMTQEEQITLKGHSAGHYLRIEIGTMPCEFIMHFDPHFPVVVGGLNPQEDTLGMVQVRLKKHRWHRKILKTSDPFIVSLGWRRFQTQPLYSMRDHNGRNRALKYTPEHMHCYATFFGPITPPNTGLVAFQYLDPNTKEFRISATGVVLELNQTFEIVKKLKLIGYPYEIKRKTAFVKDMFNSYLEANKFVGAALRTVAGIRGQIKKAQATPPGAFRATFEDKILKSDIVMLRTWYPLHPKKYYNPVTDLLTPDRASGWQGMKTIFQLRKERNIPIPVLPDSNYRNITRRTSKQLTLKIPKKLAAKCVSNCELSVGVQPSHLFRED
eukprot:TRINITY_DN10462_c0_g2_i3.p1 TRINITY_DN10462_c0_g2~~TRINITY_DN10462_c0_g2_i3.p1  ORF type:complete len:501 (-),score=129.83 TRINITY_DN10462_c0_g2_i3:46-1332(-)